eukprot:sb/3463485/
MAKKFSADFLISIPRNRQLGDLEQFAGDWRLFHGFSWNVAVSKPRGKDFFEALLHINPVNASKNWSCSVDFSLEHGVTRKSDKHTFTGKEYDGDGYGHGWDNFMKDSGKNEIKITASVVITQSNLGEAPVQPIVQDENSTVVLSRIIRLTGVPDLNKIILEKFGRSWIVEVERRGPRHLKFKVNGYNPGTGVLENLDESVLILVRQNPTLRQTRLLGQYVNFNLKNNVGASVLVTFIIIDHMHSPNPPCEQEPTVTGINLASVNSPAIEKPAGIDFGKEYLSLPAHGNNSFVLSDDTNIPLNSYVLSRNSPVLKNLIEEVGELDHDVSDFEPESVRIFVDACYTGKLEKLVDSTEFKVFSDFLKMVFVFKVDWAKEGCLVFFKQQLAKSLNEFTGYWECALLALDCSVKFGDDKFLTHIFSSVPENKTGFQFKIPRFLAATSKRPEMDLLMALAVQFELHSTFVQHLTSILDLGYTLPLRDYILENFNFSLYDKETMAFLSEALSRCISPEYACNFMTSVETENLKEALTEDGTLATIARNRWLNTKDSNWPCSTKKPFSQTKRVL